MHPISLQATTPILELRGASSASLNALHPPPSANPTQRAICCRIFTPAALPEYPAASVRDYCSGAYTPRDSSAQAIMCSVLPAMPKKKLGGGRTHSGERATSPE